MSCCRRPGRSKRRAPAATLSARDAAWSLTSTFGRSASPRWRLSWQRHSRPRHRICSSISGPSQRRAGPSSAQPGRPMTWPSAARLPIAVPSIGDMWTPLYTTRPSRAGPSRFLGAAIAWRTHTSRECLHAPVDATAAPTPTESRSVRPGRLSGAAGRAGSAVDICRLFNSPGGSRCRFVQCRYAHLCTGCWRPHPLAECGEKRPQTPSGAAGGGHGGTPPHSTA